MKINELKKDAKIKLTGSYLKCASSSLLYFIIISLLNIAQVKLANSVQNSLLSAIIQALFVIVNWVLSYGIIANILDLIDVKTNSITDFINDTLKSFVKYTKIGFYALIKIIWPVILMIFALFYWVGTKIAVINKVNFLCFNKNLLNLASFICVLAGVILIYYVLKYLLVAYIYRDNPDMSEKDIVEKSRKLMHRNKFNYILLLLSFLPWFIVASFILFLLSQFIKPQYLTPLMVIFYASIRPYVIVSKNEFYREALEEKEGTEENPEKVEKQDNK